MNITPITRQRSREMPKPKTELLATLTATLVAPFQGFETAGLTLQNPMPTRIRLLTEDEVASALANATAILSAIESGVET